MYCEQRFVAQGRAITILEDVYPEKKLGNKKIHNRFLERLKNNPISRQSMRNN